MPVLPSHTIWSKNKKVDKSAFLDWKKKPKRGVRHKKDNSAENSQFYTRWIITFPNKIKGSGVPGAFGLMRAWRSLMNCKMDRNGKLFEAISIIRRTHTEHISQGEKLSIISTLTWLIGQTDLEQSKNFSSQASCFVNILRGSRLSITQEFRTILYCPAYLIPCFSFVQIYNSKSKLCSGNIQWTHFLICRT